MLDLLEDEGEASREANEADRETINPVSSSAWSGLRVLLKLLWTCWIRFGLVLTNLAGDERWESVRKISSSKLPLIEPASEG